MEKKGYTIEQFETALLAVNVVIEEMKSMRGRYVHKAIGYVHGHKHVWDSEGKCFTKSGTPNPMYNLKF